MMGCPKRGILNQVDGWGGLGFGGWLREELEFLGWKSEIRWNK